MGRAIYSERHRDHPGGPRFEAWGTLSLQGWHENLETTKDHRMRDHRDRRLRKRAFEGRNSSQCDLTQVKPGVKSRAKGLANHKGPWCPLPETFQGSGVTESRAQRVELRR